MAETFHPIFCRRHCVVVNVSLSKTPPVAFNVMLVAQPLINFPNFYILSKHGVDRIRGYDARAFLKFPVLLLIDLHISVSLRGRVD